MNKEGKIKSLRFLTLASLIYLLGGSIAFGQQAETQNANRLYDPECKCYSVKTVFSVREFIQELSKSATSMIGGFKSGAFERELNVVRDGLQLSFESLYRRLRYGEKPNLTDSLQTMEGVYRPNKELCHIHQWKLKANSDTWNGERDMAPTYHLFKYNIKAIELRMIDNSNEGNPYSMQIDVRTEEGGSYKRLLQIDESMSHSQNITDSNTDRRTNPISVSFDKNKKTGLIYMKELEYDPLVAKYPYFHCLMTKDERASARFLLREQKVLQTEVSGQEGAQ